MHRAQQIQFWLEQFFGDQNFEINYLAGDASFRRYARIKKDHHSYMLMDAPPEKEDCLPFVQIADYLQQQGCRVPQILAQDLSHGFLLLEDFGDQLLANILTTQTVDGCYLQAFQQIIQLQSIDARQDVLPVYSAQKLIAEMRLFEEWLLPSLGIELSVEQQHLLQDSYQQIVANLTAQPQVIVHRDYHSRNLMVLASEQVFGVIDFQDAVLGPDSYDLISIIRDAYVQWPVQQVQSWIATFYQLLPASQKQDRDLSQFKRDCELMSIQRHLKVLGIFVRLFERDGKTGYLKDLPRVMWYLQQQLANCAELSALQQFINTEVIACFNAKYGEYVEVAA